MTKIFVPLLAVAMFVFGNVNAQKPAPPVKKETVPVNKTPVPVARPVVPVAKPAAPTVSKPVSPAAAPVSVKKGTAPAVTPNAAKPAAPATTPAVSKTVTTVTKKTITTEPCPPIKAKPAISKAPAKKAARKTKQAPATVSPVIAQPTVREVAPSQPEVVMPTAKPAPSYVEKEHEAMESSASCESWKSINGCSCYKHMKGNCGHHWKNADCDASCRYIKARHKGSCGHSVCDGRRHHRRHNHCCH